MEPTFRKGYKTSSIKNLTKTRIFNKLNYKHTYGGPRSLIKNLSEVAGNFCLYYKHCVFKNP